MSNDAYRKAGAQFQAKKVRVNVWMSPEGKEKFSAYAKQRGISLFRSIFCVLSKKTPVSFVILKGN